MTNKEENKKQPSPNERKTYTTPQLKEYGAIERRTGGGTGSNVEGSMSMSSMRRTN